MLLAGITRGVYSVDISSLVPVRSLIQSRIRKLIESINIYDTPIFEDQDVAKQLSNLHDRYVISSLIKPQTIIFLCVNLN